MRLDDRRPRQAAERLAIAKIVADILEATPFDAAVAADIFAQHSLKIRY
jgi:hypothetical protein